MKHIFVIIWIVWLLSEVVLNRFVRSKMNNSKDLDKNSMLIIWIVIFISISLGVLCSIYLYQPIIDSNTIRYLGLCMIVAGIIIRMISIGTLGKYFTVNLAVHEDHKLVRNGLYRYIRHPSYTGSLLSFLGLGLTFNNWIGLVVIFIPILSSFLYRINIEEKLLLDRFGSEYSEYKTHSKRLIPMIY